MFSCGHFSYIYANLARTCGLRYWALSRRERSCEVPEYMNDSSRQNLNHHMHWERSEIEPTLLQAIRYQLWFDHESQHSR